ncbi:MAG: hypothetical protein IJV44_00975 [Prevotella sp.]|nr:hypothetical protein [Prevotella sp.]
MALNLNKNLIAIFSTLFLIMGMIACSGDDEDIIPYQFAEQIGEVNDLMGTVHYDTDYDVWYIVIDNADNSNDTRYDLPFIGTKEKELLEEKLPVKFSGAVYRWLDEEVPYNTENNFIKLSKFEIQTN